MEQPGRRTTAREGNGTIRTTNNSKRGDPYIEAFLERVAVRAPPWERRLQALPGGRRAAAEARGRVGEAGPPSSTGHPETKQPGGDPAATPPPPRPVILRR